MNYSLRLGRPRGGQWVTAYELGYSLNDEDWFYVVDNDNNIVQFQVIYDELIAYEYLKHSYHTKKNNIMN